MPAIATQQKDSRRRVLRYYSKVRSATRAALAAERHKERTQTSLTNLREEYPRWRELDLRQVTLSLIMAAGFLAVYLIDLVILWPALEFLVSPVFESRRLAALAGFAVPAAVLTLETMFAAQRDEAKEKALDGDGWALYGWWTGVATLFAVAMPAAVTATFLSAQYALPAAASKALLLMLVALSLGGHIAILFGGRRSLDAMTDTLFLVRHRFLESRSNGAEDRRQAAADDSGERFSAYQRAFEDHNRRYPDDTVPPGEFSPRMQQIIEQALGRPAFQRESPAAGDPPQAEAPVPSGVVQNGPSPHSHQPQPELGAGQGENEYLRSILGRRIRDDEAEVTD